MHNVEFLLVSCCLEPTRHAVLRQVVSNITQNVLPHIEQGKFTAFDNASTIEGVTTELKNTFDNVFVSNTNVGYWSAIAWWLEHIRDHDVCYTYIIESDMIHYAFDKFMPCVKFLDTHDDFSAVRLHPWSHAERHLFDKNNPVAGSRRECWQSYVNYKTKKRVTFFDINDVEDVKLYGSHFLTQLPALNRYSAMCSAFNDISQRDRFVEPDFQCAYYDLTDGQPVAIVDGGIFQHELGCFNAKTITGSYGTTEMLAKIGYHNTRTANIVKRDQYTVTKA
jgi:hypothetical protein